VSAKGRNAINMTSSWSKRLKIRRQRVSLLNSCSISLPIVRGSAVDGQGWSAGDARRARLGARRSESIEPSTPGSFVRASQKRTPAQRRGSAAVNQRSGLSVRQVTSPARCPSWRTRNPAPC
jgi:hypothetical protein